ncbi:hypothetical protein CHELA1G11_11568 [Hyphomicrobiales bacterium]|nr:hypothetical protein CHELA1G11_11568 [Hyphomicrobiales bacterium]CAH1666846.1 hypothetical protein CHELA1G2_12741 [Hyphomicrobiales bacterium]
MGNWDMGMTRLRMLAIEAIRSWQALGAVSGIAGIGTP